MRIGSCSIFLLAAGLAATVACSSTTVINNQGSGPDAGGDGGGLLGVPDPGDASTTDAAAAPDADGPNATNPYGTAYPTTNLGWKPRAGATRGDRIANLTFTGYAPSATSTSALSLAAVYDPEGRTHDIVALLAVGLWDNYSSQMITSLASSVPSRTAIVVVVGQGTKPGDDATLADLAVQRARLPQAVNVLDAGFKLLGPMFDAAALPFVAVLDARTMEIVSAAVGALPNPKQSLEDARTAVLSRPPAY